MCTDRLDVETPRTLRLDGPIEFECGTVLEGVRVAYRTWGKLAPAADNTVVVCHALTGSADADLWWGDLFGPGKALDPDRDGSRGGGEGTRVARARPRAVAQPARRFLEFSRARR